MRYYFFFDKLIEKNMNLSFFLERVLGVRRFYWVMVEVEIDRIFLESKEVWC